FLIKKSTATPFTTVIRPLSYQQLTDPNVLENLAFLNQLQLDVYQYGQALRFISWPLSVFRRIQPYVSLFTYTGDPALADDYHTIIEFAETLSPNDRELILKTFNLIYLTAHEQLVEPVAQKLINAVRIHGLNDLVDFYTSLSEKQYKLAFCV